MRKQHASSDKKIEETNYLPSNTLWRAAQLIAKKGLEIPPLDAEPAPREMLGLAIGILRRQKHISRFQLAEGIGCTMEELLALEAGLLSPSDILQYLPQILSTMGLPENLLGPFLINIKFA